MSSGVHGLDKATMTKMLYECQSLVICGCSREECCVYERGCLWGGWVITQTHKRIWEDLNSLSMHHVGHSCSASRIGPHSQIALGSYHNPRWVDLSALLLDLANCEQLDAKVESVVVLAGMAEGKMGG